MGSENTGLLEVTMNGLIKTGEKRGKTLYVLTTNIFSIFIENSYKVTFYHIFQYLS